MTTSPALTIHALIRSSWGTYRCNTRLLNMRLYEAPLLPNVAYPPIEKDPFPHRRNHDRIRLHLIGHPSTLTPAESPEKPSSQNTRGTLFFRPGRA